MYELLTFAEIHWFQAIVYFLATLTAVTWAAYNLLLVWTRLLRCVMVCLRGWPPPHLDADGDWSPSGAQTSDAAAPSSIPPHPVLGPMKRDEKGNVVPLNDSVSPD